MPLATPKMLGLGLGGGTAFLGVIYLLIRGSSSLLGNVQADRAQTDALSNLREQVNQQRSEIEELYQQLGSLRSDLETVTDEAGRARTEANAAVRHALQCEQCLADAGVAIPSRPRGFRAEGTHHE